MRPMCRLRMHCIFKSLWITTSAELPHYVVTAGIFITFTVVPQKERHSVNVAYTRPNVKCLLPQRYVSLSDNEKTGFKARELKSVHVDAIGTYLQITFHRNHINRYNLYNQVLHHHDAPTVNPYLPPMMSYTHVFYAYL